MNDQDMPEAIYTPGALHAQGFKLWPIMFAGVWTYRELLYRMILRDISVRYRQSLLGYVWAVAPQIATATVFAYLASSRVLPITGVPVPYLAYALWSLAVWNFFASCLSGSTASLAAAGQMVTKVNFPKELLVIAPVGTACFDFLVRLLPVAAAFAWLGVRPFPLAFLLPILLIPLALFGIGLGFFFSLGNLVLRDVGNAVGMLLTFGMFLTPVLYPPPTTDPLYLINFLNPLSPLVTATQQAMFQGFFSSASLWGVYSTVSLVTFLVGWRFFYLVLPRIAERA